MLLENAAVGHGVAKRLMSGDRLHPYNASLLHRAVHRVQLTV
jgi:hypothetical protein